jgi:starvation-inducible outer membrane lipoprotein
MKNTLTLFVIIFTLLLTACSSTPKEVKLVKKTLLSDHHLMMSLLNRPVTEDQKMMLAFAQQRESYSNEIFVNTVSIKGPKTHAKSTNRAEHVYAALIARDINSVSIVAAE